jgi:hypothetical protein
MRLLLISLAALTISTICVSAVFLVTLTAVTRAPVGALVLVASPRT